MQEHAEYRKLHLDRTESNADQVGHGSNERDELAELAAAAADQESGMSIEAMTKFTQDMVKNSSATKQAMEKSLSATKEVMEASLHKCGTRVAVGIVIAVLVLIVQGIVWYSWVQMAELDRRRRGGRCTRLAFASCLTLLHGRVCDGHLLGVSWPNEQIAADFLFTPERSATVLAAAITAQTVPELTVALSASEASQLGRYIVEVMRNDPRIANLEVQLGTTTQHYYGVSREKTATSDAATRRAPLTLWAPVGCVKDGVATRPAAVQLLACSLCRGRRHIRNHVSAPFSSCHIHA